MLRGLGKQLRAYWAYIRRAPGTHIWLLILFATTVALHHVSPHLEHRILRRDSTNLHYLAISPVRVLVTSAFYIAGNGGWVFYFVLYNLFHVPAERWLSTRRWLLVVLVAHVGATYLSEGVLYWAIEHHRAPERARYTLDYGVSYALAGIQAVLVYWITRPWRYLWLAGLLLFYGISMLSARDFTSVGHFSAVLLGLACYPVTYGRTGSWDPALWLRTVSARLRGAARRLDRRAGADGGRGGG
ncbi:rhomboid-like protein [Kitasatospora sp. LaBMicrA B282]|uniref:rhomboid-like protein n=1 Tax=Kitasatospora sp. LaBMicrA B282 TaxID=3420949 RepID=UPI003D149AC6